MGVRGGHLLRAAGAQWRANSGTIGRGTRFPARETFRKPVRSSRAGSACHPSNVLNHGFHGLKAHATSTGWRSPFGSEMLESAVAPTFRIGLWRVRLTLSSSGSPTRFLSRSSGWRRVRDVLASAVGSSQAASDRIRCEPISAAIDGALDAGHGACWMTRPEIATLVVCAFQRFDGERYQLSAWCVMPNHVHVVIRPHAGHSLSKILQSWKGSTAYEANHRIGRSGTFWQREAYDHLIRDEAEFHHAVQYVLNNPTKAGLRDWPWIWVHPEVGK
jgi:REP element-mobilizing transposase RayT